MKIQSALMLAMAGSATASAPFMAHDSEIAADSRLGGKLLSKARRLNNKNDQGDVTWIANFSLKFKGCHSVKMFGVEGARENEGGMGMMNLVKFQLCPSGSCGSCSGGAEYIVEMREFIETYMEAQQTEAEQRCESARETCEYYCQNNENYNDDQVCQNQCLQNDGYSDCVEGENGNENKNDNKYNECREAGFGDNNNNYYNNNNNNNENKGYFVGPYCARGGSAIRLGLFKDEGCMEHVSASKYEDYYGYALPYHNTNMVSKQCISCLKNDNNNNNNNNGNYYKEPSETCTELHERAGKCEKRIKGISDYQYYTPNTDACTWMHKTLPALEKTANSNGRAQRVPTALAWIFGLMTVGFGGLSYYMYTKAQRMNVNLLGDDAKATPSEGIVA